MGRNKIKIEKIETKSNRQITFSKRKNGLIKKAYELSVLCDIDAVVMCFSPVDKLYFFSRPKGVADVLMEYVHKLDDDVPKDQESRTIIRNKDRILSLLQNVKSQDEMEAKERAAEEASRRGVHNLIPPENAYLYEDMKRQHARLMFLLRWFNKERYDVPINNLSEFEQYEERLMISLKNVRDRKKLLQSYADASLKVEQLQANSSINTEVPSLERLRISASHYNSNPQPPKMLQLQSQPQQQQSMLMQRNGVMLNMQQQTLEIPMQMQHEPAALDKKNKGKMIMTDPSPELSNRMQQRFDQETNYMQVQREFAPLNQNNQASHQRTLEEANQEHEWSNASAFQQHFYQMDHGNHHTLEEKEQGATEPQPEMNKDAIQTHQPQFEMGSSSQVNNVFGSPMISSDDSWKFDYSTCTFEQHPYQSSSMDDIDMFPLFTTIQDIEGNQANLDHNTFHNWEGPSQ